MGFLAKFGAVLVKGLAIVTGLAPIVQNAIPGTSGTVAKVESELTQLAGVTSTVEAIGQALGIHGPQKIKAAAPLVAQVILQSAFMANKKIADPVKFQNACAALGGDFADLMNSLHEDAVQEVNKA